MVVEPALAVISVLVHGVAPELAALVVLADGLAVRAAGDVRDVLDLVLVLVTPQSWPEVANAR